MNIWPRRLELKKETKAGSNQPPVRDPVQFKLELMPNYLISYLENTGSRSTRYVSMPHPNESSVLPKFLEKSDPEVARPASSTWPVQKTQPKAFEVCASIQISQRIMTVGSSNPQPYPAQGCLFGRDTLIGGFESTRIPQMPLVKLFAPVMLRKLVLQLQDRFSQEILEGLSSHLYGAWIHI